MKRQIILGAITILLSTISYYIQAPLIGPGKIDSSVVPKLFYDFHVYKLAGAYFMTAFYAVIIFIVLDQKKIIIKLIFCWLAIAETFTFFSHIIDKMYRKQLQNSGQLVASLIIFSIFCTFFLYRAIKNPKSDTFRPNRTYLIRSKPKNISGVINYIIKHAGHISVYQDGKIYGFKQSTGIVEQRQAFEKYMNNPEISLKEIPKIKNIESLVGKKYNLFKFNCNHLAKNAQRA